VNGGVLITIRLQHLKAFIEAIVAACTPANGAKLQSSELSQPLTVAFIGDQGSSDGAQAVLLLIKAEGAGSSSSRDGRARSSPCVPPGSSLEPSGQKIPFHRQLADLGVKVANLGLMIQAGAIRTAQKHRSKTIRRSALPRTHLVRMDLV